jgi:hypothetical protein
MSVAVYVTVSAIFPEMESTPETFRSTVRQLSRTDLLFCCARVNSVLTAQSDLSHEQEQTFAVQKFFSDDKIIRLD